MCNSSLGGCGGNLCVLLESFIETVPETTFLGWKGVASLQMLSSEHIRG